MEQGEKAPSFKSRTRSKVALLMSVLALAATGGWNPQSTWHYYSCGLKNVIQQPAHPTSDLARPYLVHAPRTQAQSVLMRLQNLHALHSMNTQESFDYFRQHPNYKGVDVDVNTKDGKLLLSHDAPTSNSPYFSDWLLKLEALPADKTAMLKLDIKDLSLIPQVITELQESMQRSPETWENRILILNTAFKMGALNPNVPGTIQDALALRQAFPDAVISFSVDGISRFKPTDIQAIREALQTVGGVNTLSASLDAKVSPKLMEMLEQNNAFLTVWAPRKIDRECANESRLKIPAEYRQDFWLEF